VITQETFFVCLHNCVLVDIVLVCEYSIFPLYPCLCKYVR